MIIEEKTNFKGFENSNLGDVVMTLEGLDDLGIVIPAAAAAAYYAYKKSGKKKSKSVSLPEYLDIDTFEGSRSGTIVVSDGLKGKINALFVVKHISNMVLARIPNIGLTISSDAFTALRDRTLKSNTENICFEYYDYKLRTKDNFISVDTSKKKNYCINVIFVKHFSDNKFKFAPPKYRFGYLASSFIPASKKELKVHGKVAMKISGKPAKPATVVSSKFKEAAASFAKTQKKQIIDNKFKLGSEIEQLKRQYNEVRSKVIDAEKMNDVSAGRRLAPMLLKLTKGIANKTTRLNLYKQQEVYVNKFEEAIEKGDVNSVVANQAGVKMTGDYINKFKDVARYLGDKDELEMKKSEINALKSEKEQLKVASNYDSEAHNTLIDIEERESELQDDIEKLENVVHSEESAIMEDPLTKEMVMDSVENGLEGLAVNIAEFSEFADVGNLSSLDGFFNNLWKATKKVASVPVKAAKWVGNKTIGAAKWVAGSAGKIAGSALSPIMSSIFGGGTPAPSGEMIPIDTGAGIQSQSGILSNKIVLIGGGIAALGLVYYFTRKK